MILTGLLVVLTTLTPEFTSSPGKVSKTSQQYEGTITAPGLTDSVTVYRDERGMPHIYAANEHDLYFAVGYISAQERLWQMDLIRRSTEGRLSEIFGKSFLQVDIVSRCLKMPEKSRLILKNEDPEIISCMEAYAGGINLFINTCKKLPVEFRIPGWDIASEIVYPGFKIDDTLISRARSLILSFDRVKSLGEPFVVAGHNEKTDEFDWKGYVPFDHLPFSFNPAAGYVSSAEFYLSQIETYLDGKFYRDYFSSDAVKKSAKYKLVFKP